MASRVLHFKIWVFIKLHYSHSKGLGLTLSHQYGTTDSNGSQRQAINVPYA